ncbi:conserved hypothetical protein [Serratia proteamaculans]|uniref:CopG family transcriptional regulator n=1 Tax=Serratia proteamaculans TaxID=28151 RepID=UPI0009F7A774|nr:CopG family transcriptional regulator [Serratia proteamaculans]SMB44793.1 conserved hypothetical protein [Serratia proteamaculans]
MSIITVLIPEELEGRIIAAAKQSGITSNSFILQAITEKIQRGELRRNFEDETEKRYVNVVATGKTLSWGDMRGFLESNVRLAKE